MGWSIGYRRPPESDLIDEVLLAAGKALYLMNMFEEKCSYVLRTANLTDLIQNDPIFTLEQAGTLLPKDKMLGDTLREIFCRADINVNQEHIALLGKARLARNYIAHKGAAAIGELRTYDVRHIFDALRELHAKVIDLARGDNIVSSWVYQIEEPREPLPYNLVKDYPDRVENWVFGHMPHEWLDPEWKPDHQRPRTVMAAMAYEPWYSRQCRCPHGAGDS